MNKLVRLTSQISIADNLLLIAADWKRFKTKCFKEVLMCDIGSPSASNPLETDTAVSC